MITEYLRKAKLKAAFYLKRNNTPRYIAQLGQVAKLEAKAAALAPAPVKKARKPAPLKYTATDGTKFSSKAALAKYERTLN